LALDNWSLLNVANLFFMPQKIKLPIDAVIAVTYRCNSRCVMCNIWQIKDYPEMSLGAYKKLPSSLREINISGGEPFLRHDLPELIKIVKDACPKARIIISTNGFLVDRIKQMLPKIKTIDPKIGVNFSIDGIGETHEAIRRIPGGWKKDIQSIQFCKELGIKNLGLAFTMTNENYLHARHVYNFCQKNKLKFSMAVAQSSDFYFGGANYKTKIKPNEVKREFDYLINEMLKGIKPKDWARAYFINGLYDIATGKKPPLPSGAGEDFFYLDPKGDVYPSVADKLIMGNINDNEKFSDLWRSKQAQKARDDLKGYESDYWFVCTARPAMKRNPLKVARWIFSKKYEIRNPKSETN
jgi:MoaA/NifB/PqqE/SkfB family radical SAM enzyme